MRFAIRNVNRMSCAAQPKRPQFRAQLWRALSPITNVSNRPARSFASPRSFAPASYKLRPYFCLIVTVACPAD